jgi:tetrapyrrole methylase family protein/MazG family protein
MSCKTLTLIGLGPGDPALLTRAAGDWLEHAPVVRTPAPDHPALAHLPPSRLHAVPAPSGAAVAVVVEQLATDDAVVCALPGHPHDHALVDELRQASAAHGWDVQIIPGVSLVDACCAALAISGRSSGLQVVHANVLTRPVTLVEAADSPAWCEVQQIAAYAPPRVPYPLTPTRPALVLLANEPDLRATLLQRYPAHHAVQLLWLDRQGQSERVWSGTVTDLGEQILDGATALYLPPLTVSADRRGLDGLSWVVARLLGPDGCPWDCQQTHQSLRAGLLEEAHEVLEALDAGDMPALTEELGDLLLQVLVHSEMARQAGHFDLGDVLEQISSKLIRRHPHVFDDLAVAGMDTLLHTWEQIKAQELAAKGRRRTSLLDGIPVDLPALATAQRIVTKAARVGFDWSVLPEVWEKVREEVSELEQVLAEPQTLTPAERAHLAEELGDLLFALVNLARWLDLDAESVLREANAKFRRRFTYVEQAAQLQGRELSALTIAELEELWQQAKRKVYAADGRGEEPAV